jgi:hypothetical protein
VRKLPVASAHLATRASNPEISRFADEYTGKSFERRKRWVETAALKPPRILEYAFALIK